MPKVAVQCYRWSFTIQSAGEDTALPCDRKTLEALFVDWGVKHWVYQHEKVARNHYQGEVQLKVKKRKTWLLKRCGVVDKKWVTLSPSSKGGGAFAYCLKKESRVAGPWGDKPIYMGQDLLKVPRPWQQEIISAIAKDPDSRTINWVWEADGNVGKSALAKYLAWNKMAIRIPPGNATQIKTYTIAVGSSRCYLVDFPRTDGKEERDTDMFSAVEDVKNGWIVSAMYGKVQELFMEPPHVWCFANRKPNRKLVSRDRWVEWTIEDGHLKKIN